MSFFLQIFDQDPLLNEFNALSIFGCTDTEPLCQNSQQSIWIPCSGLLKILIRFICVLGICHRKISPELKQAVRVLNLSVSILARKRDHYLPRSCLTRAGRQLESV